MEKSQMNLVIIGIVILAVIGSIAMIYNNFIGLDQSLETAWSEVNNQYQRQADLIPNLVDEVKYYSQFEKGLLTDITNARSKWQTAATPLEKDKSGMEMNSGLSRLIAVFENYPDLKTVQTLSNLMDETAGTQNRITTARGRYITSIKEYNIAVKTIPGVFFAGMFGFYEREYYKSEAVGETPDVGELLK